MITDSAFSACFAQVGEFISRHSSGNAFLDEPSTTSQGAKFNELALSLFALQFSHNAPYRRYCQSRNVTPEIVQNWQTIPAMPVSGFKELEITSLPVEQRATVFHSSGTTGQQPSRHFHDPESLSLYEASLIAWFRTHLVTMNVRLENSPALTASAQKPRVIILTPASEHAPHSSLAHMFETIRREFGSNDSLFTGRTQPDGAWSLDLDKTLAVLQEAIRVSRSVLLLGTAFNFVHLLDCLKQLDQPLQLSAGSSAMETGGYKGRSRTLPKPELHALITEWLGIPATAIICEYGMSELSSQAYDWAMGGDGQERVFHFPPWARAQIISPETGREVGEGETGLIRVFDLANVRSVMAIQTEDLGIRRGGGFELLGRAAMSETRGCSLMSA